MLIKKDSFEISVGKGVGHVLEDILLSAKTRLWVVSPWISPKYANILVKKASEGVNVKLLTSNDFSNKTHRNSVSNMITFKRKIKRSPAYLSIIFTFLFLALASIELFWLALTVVPIFIFLRYGITFVAEPKLQITIFDKRKEFTHSKIYISDHISATGSANLTESGLWRNVETIVVMRDPEVTEDISKVFHNMEDNPLMKNIELSSIRNDLK